MMDAQSRLTISSQDPQDVFELMNRLGSGSYGEVFKARNKVNGELAAVKIVKEESDEDFSVIQKEVLMLKSCAHKNIVAYYGSYMRTNKLWICMEFCGGGSLQDIYQVTGALSELQVAYVCRETLQGLAYLHNQGKMHRDIKGANILLNDTGDVKLADFGISAQLTATFARRNSFIGTPYWMAPEVAAVELKGGYTELCDVWSLGITAIELTELQPPMFHVHPLRVLFLMSKGGYQPPKLKDKSKWSSAFHNFIKASLTKNPKKRPSASKMLTHQFVAQAELGPSLTQELLEKLRNPEKHSDNSTPEEDDTELFSAFSRILSKKRNPKASRSSSDIQFHQIKNKTQKEEPRLARADRELSPQAPQSPTPYISFCSDDEDDDDDDYDDVDIPGCVDLHSDIYADESPPPLPPKPRFRTSSADVKREQDRLHTPSTLVRCSSGPCAHRNATQTYQESLRKQLPAASSEPSLLLRDFLCASPPSLPPKQQTTQAKQVGILLKKIFNGCPLKIHSATTWKHPTTKDLHVILGAEQGIYTLNLSESLASLDLLTPGWTTWVYSINNVLMSITGKVAQLYSHSLLGLHEQIRKESRLAHIPTHRLLPRKKSASTKVPDTKGCKSCTVAHDGARDSWFLCVAMETSVHLLEWYQPLEKFMLMKHFEFPLPCPLRIFEMLVVPGEQYPLVCIGIRKGSSSNGRIQFQTINLSSMSSWFTDSGNDGSCSGRVQVAQIGCDQFLVLTNNTLNLVDHQGEPLNTSCVPNVLFTFPVDSVAVSGDQVLVLRSKGFQVLRLQTAEVIVECADRSLRLLSSDSRKIIVEAPQSGNSNTTNLYIHECASHTCSGFGQ
ncbi:PREDICTED: mitogen-activated protein kinase kinase kinase kinase 1 [Nanorana parkeri]|uniref:mitogen-activated protein kinase kinase kinase kinase 1 n=1 Tax=Nanorana parkeri TaxID=125878 RepID=UPI000854C44F|nr:PREDICTED: mitogen-activated protein kinase kinase kinase kinase 1 [Nanorana parkeri]